MKTNSFPINYLAIRFVRSTSTLCHGFPCSSDFSILVIFLNVFSLLWPGIEPGLLVAQTVKRLPAVQETRVRSLGWEDPLEKEMATHSSTLAWKIPWTEEPCRLQSMASQRVGHDWATSLHLQTGFRKQDQITCYLNKYILT